MSLTLEARYGCITPLGSSAPCGAIGHRRVQRDGEIAIEFSWDGQDEMDPGFVRGCATIREVILTVEFLHTRAMILRSWRDGLRRGRNDAGCVGRNDGYQALVASFHRR